MAVASTAKTKLIKQLVLVVVIAGILRFGLNNLGWHPPSLEKKLIPALVLWVIFGLYWGIAGLNSAPTRSSESWVSTYFHQFVLCAALLLLIVPVPVSACPASFSRAVGAIIQAGFLGRGSQIGPYGAVSVAAASHLCRDAGHVPRNGGSFEPVSRAARIGNIGGRLSAKNAAGRSGPGPGFWR